MRGSIFYIAFVLLQLISIQLTAQVSFIDKSTKFPIAGMKVKVLTLASSEIYRGQTNFEGKIEFTFSCDSAYRIHAFSYEYDHVDTVIRNCPSQIFIKNKIQEQAEVVVTAQYGSSSAAKSAYNIRTIDEAKIEAMGAVNLRDVLTNELGVSLSQDNILGSGMSLQGISGENVKIMIDGVPVVGRLNGNIDLSQINLQEIARIEIVEGPLSVNYGTNALAGVVNLITKKAKYNALTGSINSYYESIGHYNLNAEVKYGTKRNNFGISGGRNLFDGWSNHHAEFSNPEPIADSNRFNTWKPKEQYFAGAFYQYKADNWNLDYKFDYFFETVWNKGTPRAPYFETAFDDKYRTGRMDNSLRLKNKVGKNGRLDNLVAYNEYNRIKNSSFIDLTTLESTLLANPSDHDTSKFNQLLARGSYIYQQSDSAFISYQIGYEIMVESAYGQRILNGVQTQQDYAAFITAEYRPLKTFLIRPGLRYSYNTSYNTPLLPSLNVKYEAFKNFFIRASYARGFRAPGIKELYFEFVDINHNIVGNTNLKAETSNNYSLDFSWKQELAKQAKITYNLTSFYNEIDNMITLGVISGTEYTYINIGEFKSIGSRLRLNLSTSKVEASIGLGVTGRVSTLESGVEDLPMNYNGEIQSALSYKFGKSTSAAVFYKYNGIVQNYFVDDLGEVTIRNNDDFHLLDLSLTQKLFKKKLALTIGIKNILDVTQINAVTSGGAHSDAAGSVSIGTGRSYFVSLSYSFHKSLNK